MRPDSTSAEPERFESIEAVFAVLESPLLLYARRLLESETMAEDVVQEAFLRLHTHYADVRDPRRWLYRTTHNLAVSQLRKEGRAQPLVAVRPDGSPDAALDLTDPQPLPDEQIAREEGMGQVRLGLEVLDDRSRELLRLKFEEDLSYKQMSARTGLTVGHVGYLLHHAIKTLAVELTKSGVVR